MVNIWYLVAVLDEAARPLANVRVEAIALWSWPDVADSKTTGRDGTAMFTALGGSVYFRACTPRYTGSARDRNFTGEVHIQVVGIGGTADMNADMIVDSNGLGTHLTLFGAGGALEEAIALGANTETFIWICATHTETRTATHTISMLSTNQRIIIMGGGQFEHNIHFNFDGPAITHNDGSGDGTGSELLFEHMGLTRDTGTSGAFMEVSGGGYVVKTWFNDVDFSAAGTWTYLLDYDTATSGIFRGLTLNSCTGVVNAVAATSTAASAVGHLIMHDCDMALVNLIERDDSTDVDLFTELMVTDNKLSVSGYLLKLAYTDASTEEVTISGNVFLHTGAVNFIELGTAASNNISRVTITGNSYYGNAAGCAFALLDVAMGGFLGVAIVGNSLTGPGAGTAITVNDACTDCLFLNAYHGWATNLSGAPTGIDPGEIGYTPGDGADWIDPDPDDVEEALDDLAARLQDVTELDFFVGTATGVLSNEIVFTYARGSIIYGGASAWDVLGIGAAGYFLKAGATDIAWAALVEADISDLGTTVCMDAEMTAHIGTPDAHHDPISLAADATVLLNLSTQEIGFVAQIKNTILAGPAAGVNADPTFRALVGADLPAGTPTGLTPTRGDIIYGNATPAWADLALGAAGTILRSDGTDIAWGTVAAVVGHAILDGSVHTDSAADAVTRGSIIIGNATPKWDELVIGGAGTYLRSDGTDITWGLLADHGHLGVAGDGGQITEASISDLQSYVLAHAMLDGAAHTDSVADAVTRGSLIYGNATPKWDELVVGGAGTYLQADGTDIFWAVLANHGHLGVAGDGGQITEASISDLQSYVLAHAMLDGAAHTDSVADAVTAGSIIIGNDTPKWDELVIAVPAANVRNVLGIDNGETTPTWKTALDATNPAAVAAAAAPGTSLVFSHRDHVHALDIGTTQGDLLVWDAAPVAVRLPIGLAGTLLQSDGTDPAWVAPATAIGHAMLDGSIHTDSVADAVTRGSLVYGNATPKWDELVKGTDGHFLKAGANDIAWAAITEADISDLQSYVLAHAMLDGSAHSDSVADAVTRGSLIVGNATPKWDELVIGGAGTVFVCDGTDPSWSVNLALGGTLTVDIINEYTGAAGVTIEGVLLEDSEVDVPGHMAIGADAVIAAHAILNVAEHKIGSGVFYALQFVAAQTLDADDALGTTGISGQVTIIPAGHDKTGDVWGVRSYMVTVGAGAVSHIDGFNAGGGLATAAVTDYHGLHVENPAADALTTLIGVKIDALTTGATNIAIQTLGGEHRFVGNVYIGADSAPAHDLVIGDDNFYLDFDGTDPFILFDANDYFQYDRSANILQFYIGSSECLRVEAAKVKFTPGISGEFYAWQEAAQSAIVFDASDALRYVRATNQFEFEIGGADVLVISASGLSSPVGLTIGDATPGDNFLLLKFNTSRAWQFETDGADGAGQKLALRTLTDGKLFNIQSPAGTIVFEVNAVDAGGRIGFYATVPIAKQVGVAVNIAAVHAALVNLGLIAA